MIEKCGIILNNEDCGAITGSDAGGSEVKTPLDILPVEGDAVYPEGSEFTVNGLTIYGIPDRSTLTEQEQLVVQGLYSWWIRDSLNLIEETYGLTLDEDGVTNHRMKLYLYSDPNSNGIAAVTTEGTGDGITDEVARLRINMAVFNDITEDNAHGYIASFNDSLDRTLAHELTHALMAVNFNYFSDLPHWFQEGTAELIVGIDGSRSAEFRRFLVDDTDKLLDMLGTNVIGTNYPYAVYTGGVIFLRYLAKQAGDQTFDYDTFSENVTVENGSALNYFSEVSVTGSSDADTILNTGLNATVNAGAGNDLINGGNFASSTIGVGALLNGDEGNDVINNFSTNATVDGGAGDDSLYDFAPGSSLNGNEGNDYIYGSSDSITLVGGDGDDSIISRAEEETLNGGAGNDLIRNLSVKNVIDAGDGNDTIIHEGFIATIDAGDGNDLIRASGDYATLTGGAGNDTFAIADGMGVVVSDFNSVDDVISIASGGSSIVNADGSITINFANAVETIDGSNDSPQVSVLKRFMASLDQSTLSGRAALDDAVRASSDFTSYDQLVDRFRNDLASCDGNWNKFLQQYCGIKLYNADTGAISGADAGGSTIKTDATIVDLGEYSDDDPYPEGDSFTVDGLTIYGIPDRAELTDDQQLVVKNLYNHWLKGALDLIKESYGLTYNEEGTTNHHLRLTFIDDENSGTLAAVHFNPLDENYVTCGGVQLVINMAKLTDLGDDELLANHIHRTITHELVHGLTASNFNYVNDMPNWFIEGAAELVVGIDDERLSEFAIMFEDDSVADYIVELEFSGDNQPYPIYTAGYTFLRYFAHQAAGDQTYVSEEGYIGNYIDDETIAPSASGTTIENAGDNVVIDLNDQTGIIYNFGENSTISGVGSSSEIINNGDYVYVDGGNGGSTITNYAEGVTLETNGGYVINNGADYIAGGDGNDTILNSARYQTWSSFETDSDGRLKFQVHNDLQSGSDAVVDGGAGNDIIVNFADRASINGGNGNDTLRNRTATLMPLMVNEGETFSTSTHACVDATLDGGAGNDIIHNTLASAWLLGGDDEDSIRNSGNEVLIDGGEGDDSITNIGDFVSIGGNHGDDLIRNAGANVTLSGGVGEDTIINEGHLVSINGGFGDDLIRSSGDHATLIGAEGADTFVVTDGVEVFIYDYNPDEDFISIASGVEGVTTLNNTVETESDLITVDGSYNNFESDTMLVGGANADSIINNALFVEVFGGGGDDSVRNEGAFCWIDLGAGNDFIRSSGDFSTITGGAGNDTFAIADGTSVVITDFNADEDVISLASGASSILNDEGFIEITVANPVEPVDSTEYTPQVGAIKRLMASLDRTTLSGTDALDEAIFAASNGSVESYADFVNRFRADLISCGGNGQRFLLKYCGINLFNEDTGAITGADAGGTLKAETDLIDVSGAASYPSSDAFTLDGLTIYGIPDQSSLTADQQMIVRDLYSWWLDGSLELINQSYGLTFNEEGTKNHRMRLDFYDVDQLWKAAVETTEGAEPAIITNLKINMHFFEGIDADDRHGINDTVNLDQVLIHELTHAAMVATIDNFNELPLWFVEGSAELVRGIDTSGNRRPLIIQYANDGNALIDMLNGDASDDVYVSYAGGYIAMRYMAKQFSGQTFDYDEYRPTIKGNDQLNYFDDVKMLGTSKADTIVNVGDEVSINAKGGDDYIISTGDDVTIKTGGGNDTISIESGSAWIKDYSARKDTLLLGDGASTVESHGGILITFDATSAQLSAMIEVEEPTDELSDLMSPTAIEIGFDDHSFDHQLFDRDQILSATITQRRRQQNK